MIKLFRRIRQSLLSENKLSKYLLYAIGEIILVVIGILIALQINNWNEDRKEEKAIEKVLNEIKDDLLEDKKELETILAMRNEDASAQNRIIQAVKRQAVFNDSLFSDLGRVGLFRPYFSSSKGYELLKELNLGNLDDRELRNLISRYYERAIPAVQQETSDDKLEFESFWLPYTRKNLSEWNFGEYAVPRDNNQMLEDEVLLAFLKTNLGNLNNTTEAYEEALETSNILIQMIESKYSE